MTPGTLSAEVSADRRALLVVERCKRVGGAAHEGEEFLAHRLDLGCVRLHREEYDLLAGHFFQMLEEAVPDLGIERGIFDGRIGEHQG